jgi:hypothetical protein
MQALFQFSTVCISTYVDIFPDCGRLAVQHLARYAAVVEAVHQAVSPPAYSRKNSGLPSRSLLDQGGEFQNGRPTLRSASARDSA